MKNEGNSCQIGQGCRVIIVLWTATKKMDLACCSRAVTNTKLHNTKPLLGIGIGTEKHWQLGNRFKSITGKWQLQIS